MMRLRSSSKLAAQPQPIGTCQWAMACCRCTTRSSSTTRSTPTRTPWAAAACSSNSAAAAIGGSRATRIVAAAAPAGPPYGTTTSSSSSSSSSEKPSWVRILEEDAAVDEEVAELLEGTGGDPDKIRAKMEAKLKSPFGSSTAAASSPPAAGSGSSSSSTPPPASGPAAAGFFEARTGSDAPPRVAFREVDVLDLWVWLEFLVPPSAREQELLQSTLKSWYVVGKLGGFNSQNLQVYYSNSDDNSFLEYDSEEAASSMSSYMHSCSDAEFKGSLARFNVDLGTSDELALDVLINMLAGFSHEVAGIARITVGGEHERWQVPPSSRSEDGDGDDADVDAADGRPRRQHGQAPKVGINPMRLPRGMDEELELMDELGLYDPSKEHQQQQQQSQPPQRPWGQGLRPRAAGRPAAGAAVRGRGAILTRRPGQAQQQQQQQQNRQPPQQQGAPGDVSGDVPEGMSMYSEAEFRRVFGADAGSLAE